MERLDALPLQVPGMPDVAPVEGKPKLKLTPKERRKLAEEIAMEWIWNFVNLPRHVKAEHMDAARRAERCIDKILAARKP